MLAPTPTGTPTDPTGRRQRFGRHRLLARIGQGGMADVYLAVVDGSDKLIVIKRMRDFIQDSPEFITMFADEARIAARLNHPNIVETNEVGDVDGQYYLAMEFLDGQPLGRILSRARNQSFALPPEFNLLVIIHTLRGLHHAHELRDYDGSPMNIVHRDVSPQNVFLTYDGQVKVVDFGIAKAEGRLTDATRQGVVKGKRRFMAPEQIRGDIDRRADIFAAGVMLYNAIAPKRMWDAVEHDIVVVKKLLAGDYPRSPRQANADVPAALDAICAKALAFAKEERYATAQEFRLDLERYLATTAFAGDPRSVLAGVVTTLFAEQRKELQHLVARAMGTLRQSEETAQILVESGNLTASSVSGAESDGRGQSSPEHALTPRPRPITPEVIAAAEAPTICEDLGDLHAKPVRASRAGRSLLAVLIVALWLGAGAAWYHIATRPAKTIEPSPKPLPAASPTAAPNGAPGAGHVGLGATKDSVIYLDAGARSPGATRSTASGPSAPP